MVPSGRRKVLFRLLAAVLPILAIEALARTYWVQFVDDAKTDTELYEAALGEKVLGDEVPYQFFPNHEFVVADTPTRTNNLRLRGDTDIDLSISYSGTRILCIGDSVTFGYTVSGNAATYPAVLQRLLEERGISCQVLNAGMPRFRIEHLAVLFQDRLRDCDADIAVILGGWNNANDHVLRPAAGRDWRSLLDEHWYMLKVVRHWNVLPRLGGIDRVPARIDREGVSRYGEALRRLIQRTRNAGARPILCTLPHFFHSVDDSRAREKAATFTPVGTLEQLAEVADTMNDEIRRVAAAEQIPVVELGSINGHELFGDAIHPNDEGSARIAELVAEFLTDPSGLGRSDQSDLNPTG